MKIRPAVTTDIVVGNELVLVGDDEKLFVKIVEEVLHPNDDWKAFCADDGSRYGLLGLWVIEP